MFKKATGKFFILFVCVLFIYGSARASTDSFKDIISNWSNQSSSFQKVGKYLIQSDQVRAFYQERAFEPIWTSSSFINKGLNSKGKELVELLKNPSEFGFLNKELIDNNFLAILEKPMNDSVLFWTEILLTEKWLLLNRFVNQGRLLNYQLLDDDTRIIRKNPVTPLQIAQNSKLLDSGKSVKEVVRLMEPTNWVYQNLKKSLMSFNQIEADKKWKAVDPTIVKLTVGASSDLIADLKNQLVNLGFTFQTMGPVYDNELKSKLIEFHSLYKTGENGITNTVVKILNVSIEDRKEKIMIGMEKARMLPATLEADYVFVNLAFQEMKVFEQSKVAMSMKTINGKKFKRTPTMRDIIGHIELNSWWTVPASIAKKVKLKSIKNDINFLYNNNMKLYDSYGNEVNPYEVNWTDINEDNFTYTIKQAPSADNALGYIKFPLTNPINIYLHDTNERYKFKLAQRLESSGCIRLEKPLDFANYLLRDNADYTPEVIKQIINVGLKMGESAETTKIALKKNLPVYTMYITTDISENGIIRFVDDAYGSDNRMAGIIHSKESIFDDQDFELKLKEVPSVLDISSEKSGITVSGKVSDLHYSKMIRLYKCEKNKKNSCQLSGFLDVGKSYELDPGDYILIFENQIYPEVISLKASQSKNIPLITINLPSTLSAEKRIRIFHDVKNQIEQKKILIENFYFSTSPLKFSQYDFGDFYLTTPGHKAINERVNYTMCNSGPMNSYSEEGNDICKTYFKAKSPDSLASLFTFGAISLDVKYNDGDYYQSWISKPGHQVILLQKRRLVVAPVAYGGEVTVFKGQYKAVGESTNAISIIKALEQ